MTVIYLCTGDIFYLIELEGFGFASVLTMVFAGQVYLRYKEPDIPRPIKVNNTYRHTCRLPALLWGDDPTPSQIILV